MRILYYSPHPHLSTGSPTGYGTHMRETIAAMRALGHEVEVLVMGGNATATVTAPAAGGVKNILRKIVPRYLWRSLKDRRLRAFDVQAQQQLEARIRTFKPELIYERMAYLQPSGSNASKAAGVMHIVEVNAPLTEEVRSFEGAGSFYAAAAEQCMQQVMQHAHRVVVVSSALRDAFVKQFRIAETKFIVAPNCVAPETLRINETAAATVTKYVLPGERVIGFVGSIFPYHGVDILLDAFAALRKTEPNIRLLLVGDGYLLPQLKQRAAELGCADSVTFTGPVPASDVASYIAKMDVTVMAKSNWYGSPVKIFEYGAMGKPIVAPDTIPVRDVMEPGVDGLLVQPEVAAVQKAIQHLLQNPAEANQMAAHFREKVMTQFTWQQSVERVLRSCR
jgi:glycosyltransferase involved in cell wall biosynthesis